MVMTEYACFDKTGTLTTEQLKVKAIMLDDRIYKFSRKKLKVNAWVQYKSDINIQLASNKLVIDESEDDSPESK
jgi:magnesium-transporting ATPase (P-type)